MVQPRSDAMRCAMARAATRRGCSRISGPASMRAGGTRVVLPAPGCADTTTARDRRTCSTISPTNGSIGSDSIVTGVLLLQAGGPVHDHGDRRSLRFSRRDRDEKPLSVLCDVVRNEDVGQAAV